MRGGGHPGAKLAAGPAEEHQPATTCILADGPVSLDMNSTPPPPPPQHPLTSANPPLTLPRPPPLFCCDKTHLLPGRVPLPLLVSASDLSVKAAWILCDGGTVASAVNPVFI